MSLDIEVQRLLRSPPVQQINFTIGGLRVTGPGFNAVAACLTADQSVSPVSNRIRITTNPRIVGRHIAVYSPDVDKLHLRSTTILGTLVGRSHVVHECTHAQLDYRGRSSSIRSEESAAFIAETWYLLNAKCDMNSANADPVIVDVVIQIRDRHLRGGGTPVEVTPDELNACRAVMARNYRYSMAFGSPGHRHGYTSDGIRGRIYRGA